MAFCSLWLGVIIMLNARALLTKCVELRDNTRCIFNDKHTCEKAQSKQCEWCELPQECHHLAVVSKLGVNCNGSQRRRLKEVEDCASIASKDKCLSLDHCRWCRSESLDDGCFGAWEARKLPLEVFECTKGS
ncbi:hypothetical protein GOP47_0020226 [Adiantum capillus-veneris]|uniref:Uncharacterized protein n=1 Tax=Adiantum capillus-veneris TaxID=13818 RepID=A0A9D4ZAE5_ADICA|nr:hypothetical protein GOP47_0020226 [Adiantum capillus-veneris]